MYFFSNVLARASEANSSMRNEEMKSDLASVLGKRKMKAVDVDVDVDAEEEVEEDEDVEEVEGQFIAPDEISKSSSQSHIGTNNYFQYLLNVFLSIISFIGRISVQVI